MLEVAKLRCERDDRVLFSNLSIQLSPGELLQIEGCNGAGKTTLLRVLAGLSGDYRGQVIWRGQKLSRVYADFRLSTFYFGHKPAVKTELTPVENILWRSSLRNESYSEQSVFSALEHVNLAGYEDIPCGQLSAGQHRRVALADLSLSTTPLWILDEPFTAIDVDGVAWLEQRLAQHISEGGAVVMTSHQSLSKLSDRVRKLRLEAFSAVDEETGHEESEAWL
ncbi:cytochrome c biogenesis heme-transporting ATPase CcmA [Endozoicomonas numazuensis]|uniref:cytochrome c biogenesis heme-transporting ATPase CcmA n=1 Tax=Endozoicomonas numazuensis TaxID=1137799 RepID=UPI00069005B3|nr:cytochrome c biogenesis heme-transporting ATPase CcmA [Endozoicomonas numazuensis]